jgi:hypothetical protein
MRTPSVVVIVYAVCGDLFLQTRKMGARIEDLRGTALAIFSSSAATSSAH